MGNAFENIVEKRENASDQHFLFFPTIFLSDINKFLDLTLSQMTNFRLFQTESICRLQNKFEKIKTYFEKDRKHCGKRRKCWLPAFSTFPTIFSKAFSLGVVKSRDCVV